MTTRTLFILAAIGLTVKLILAAGGLREARKNKERPLSEEEWRRYQAP